MNGRLRLVANLEHSACRNTSLSRGRRPINLPVHTPRTQSDAIGEFYYYIAAGIQALESNTGSTQARALDASGDLGADIQVSYEMSSTRLHASRGCSFHCSKSQNRDNKECVHVWSQLKSHLTG